jgi:hypothetical protein
MMKTWHLARPLTLLLLLQHVLITSAYAERKENPAIVPTSPNDEKVEKDPNANTKSANKFYPNITSGAETAGPWNVEWQPSPTELIPEMGFFTNNLSLGLGERLEVGIVPLQYSAWFSPMPKDVRYDVYEAMVKWNFFRTDTISLGIVYSGMFTHLQMNRAVPNDGDGESDAGSPYSGAPTRIDVKNFTHQYALLANYRFLFEWNLGVNVRGNYHYSDNSAVNSLYSSIAIYRRLIHVRTDLMQPINSAFRITYSASREYLLALSGSDGQFHLVHGFGCGLTWVRPGKTISSAGFGFHQSIEYEYTDYTFHLSFD